MRYVFRAFHIPSLAHSLSSLFANPRKTGLFRDAFWVVCAQILYGIGLLLGIRLLTQCLGPEIYGGINLLLGIEAIIINIVFQPLFQAGQRAYPDMEGCFSILRTSMYYSVLCLVAPIFTLLFASHLFLLPATTPGFFTWIALAGLMCVDIFRLLETSLLSAQQKHCAAGVWLATDTIAKPILAIFFINYLGATFFATISGFFTAAALTFIPFYCFTGKCHRPLFPVLGAQHSVLLRQLWRFALPLLPLGILSALSSFSDRFLIAGFIGIEQAGIYAAAFALATRPFTLVFSVLDAILRPLLYKAVSEHKVITESNIMMAWIVALGLFGVLGTLGLYAFKEILTSSFLGSNYSAASALLPWIGLGGAMLSLSLTCERRFLAHRRTRIVLILRSISTLCGLALLCGLVYIGGLTGAAMSCSLCAGIHMFIVLFCWIRYPESEP